MPMFDGASNTNANHGTFVDVQSNYIRIDTFTVNVHHDMATQSGEDAVPVLEHRIIF